MLETLAQLVVVWPAARERLEELVDIVTEHVVAEPGAIHLAFSRDWRPVPHVTDFAHCLQTARTLIQADHALHGDNLDAGVLATARSLVDNTLEVAWDAKHGGFHHAGWPFGPTVIEGCRLFVPDKVWWCQAEGLHALFRLVQWLPDSGYEHWLLNLWRYIDRFIIDHRRGGWCQKGTDSVRYDRRAPMASIWKDPSHEGVALLVGLEVIGDRRPERSRQSQTLEIRGQ